MRSCEQPFQVLASRVASGLLRNRKSYMDINRLTEKTQEALHAAQSEALRRGNQQVDVEHLLAALLAQEGGLAASILKRAGANVEALAAKLNQELDRLPKVSGPTG